MSSRKLAGASRRGSPFVLHRRRGKAIHCSAASECEPPAVHSAGPLVAPRSPRSSESPPEGQGQLGGDSSNQAPHPPDPGSGAASWRGSLAPLVLTLLLGLFLLMPRVAGNPTLVWTFVGVIGALLAWQAILWGARLRDPSRRMLVELVPPVKSHYVQASVQFGIYLYWGWHWREIYSQMPFILAQLIFLTVVDALISWTRHGGRQPWRPGFGVLPIVFSTNFFLWFRDDFFYLQFLMVASGALGKAFITWNRDGRRTHIFNPSALGLTLFSILLLATGMTREWSWARELATTIDSPEHIYLVIFLLGLVVQSMFAVTLMTLAAAGTLCLLNLVYTEVTGVYHFISINISAAVFLGLHLLMTDPATSPRTNLGRLIFGALYGVGIFICYELLQYFDAPELYSKLLPVPILNLLSPWLERITRTGTLGDVNRRWESLLRPALLNLVHMACWAALFFTMLWTDFIQGPHPGYSIPFWKQAHADERPKAGRGLVVVTLTQANNGSASAINELGVMVMEAKIAGVEQSDARAARYFSQACEAGNMSASCNVAKQFLFLNQRRSDEDVIRALLQIELGLRVTEGGTPAYLVGYAYETGRGRQWDLQRGGDLYRRCGWHHPQAVKGLARLAITAAKAPADLPQIVEVLHRLADAGDAESCWYLAYLHVGGRLESGVDMAAARRFLERACEFAQDKLADPACAAMLSDEIPPYSVPRIEPPPWQSDFPLEPRIRATDT